MLSVVWYVNVAGIALCNEMPTLFAVEGPVLMIVTNAVAELPIWTDLLVGKTAATKDCAQGRRLEGFPVKPWQSSTPTSSSRARTPS